MLEIIKKKQKQQSLPLIISNFERGITTIAKRQTKRDAKREREKKIETTDFSFEHEIGIIE